MKKNDKIEICIEDIGASGEGIAHYDGVTVFVPYLLKGEEALVHILKVKNNIAFAKIVEIKKAADERITAKCKYFTKCGGCVLQHACKQEELEIKKNKILTVFRKIAGINLDDIKMFDSKLEYGYRNKCAFPIREINGKACVCMFKSDSHTPIAIECCELADPVINKVINLFNSFLEFYQIQAYNDETLTGDVKFLVVRVVNGVPLITVVINKKDFKEILEFEKLVAVNFENFGLNLNINTVNNNVILSDKFKHISGNETLSALEYGVSYPISSLSFLQINDYIKNLIYEKVLSKVNFNDTVIDAYSGAGLLSAIIAKKAKQVYGIEIIKAATDNANELIKLNDIKNLVNINGDCTIELPKLIHGLKSKNIKVVLDPPRKGASREVIDAIIKACVNNIVYVSCNPATLARDSKILLDAGYKIVEVEGFNMFPQTEHVETVAIFEKE